MLYIEDYSSFELVFTENSKDGSILMLSRVIMRNLGHILKIPQLDLLMRPFFNDDKDNHCQVRFAMELPENDLAVYQTESFITGVDFDH